VSPHGGAALCAGVHCARELPLPARLRDACTACHGASVPSQLHAHLHLLPLPPRVFQPLQFLLGRDAVRYHMRHTCTSVVAAKESGSGSGHGADAAMDVQPVLGAERTVWVKKEGDPVFAKLLTTAADVGDLTKAIAENLGMTQRLSTVTLHIAKDTAGTVTGGALDSRQTLDGAGLQDGASIVVQVAGGAAAAAKLGELGLRLSADKLRTAVAQLPLNCLHALLHPPFRRALQRRWRHTPLAT
jgi:hypothetical protein